MPAPTRERRMERGAAVPLGSARRRRRQPPVRTEPGDYPQFYRALSAALHGDEAVPVDRDDAVRTLTIIEAAQRSALNAEVVAIQEVDARRPT